MLTEEDDIVLELVRDAFRMTFAAIGADRVVQRSLFPSDWKERYNNRLSGTKAYADKLYDRMHLSTAINFNGVGVFVLDNVVCTGVTASAALEVLPDATVVALAMSSWR